MRDEPFDITESPRALLWLVKGHDTSLEVVGWNDSDLWFADRRQVLPKAYVMWWGAIDLGDEGRDVLALATNHGTNVDCRSWKTILHVNGLPCAHEIFVWNLRESI